MATINVKFRLSAVSGKPGNLYYRVCHEREVRHIVTPYQLYPTEWDARRELPCKPKNEERASYVVDIRKCIFQEITRFKRIVGQLDQHGADYTVDYLVEEMEKYEHEYTFYNLMKEQIAKKQDKGKIRTAETYTVALNNFRKFRQGVDIPVDMITSSEIERYEIWQERRGISNNTISFYNRVLRAVYNRAVKKGLTDNKRPFRDVYTGVGQTVKRAIPLSGMKRLMNLNLSHNPKMDFARDMFMMSFFLRGMSFIDMAFLRKEDLKNGFITYRRHKTGQLLNIRWIKEMQKIMDKYPRNKTKYLLPILITNERNERVAYRNSADRINRQLKSLGSMVGVGGPLTLYCARHSWASIAKSKGIPISVISEGLGHDSENTTKIYLASLDTSAVDRANVKVINALQELR